ncbi:DNA replication/repair protein RecF [Lentisphaera profundi]|uniref:DNA replication and repair protein RecF n=1 Tax=Lentisphaera profundi TaxID=1658616 RepID=A0ABY7VTE2_9BACT|nr:DNA replication/repair protein RecF [Lentisphaera profundi]WDE96147.1 DNA replication/repair protein RecF [Lentisphaera profundi]
MGFISRIQLKNFRNYPELELNLEPGISVFRGRNGQGKTAFLESLGFLSLLRSIRSSNTRHLKNWQGDFFSLRACLDRVTRPELDLSVYYGEKRQLSLDGNRVATTSDFIGVVKSVAFMPEDIEIVKGSASWRRQYIDILLSQLSPHYLQSLKHYQKALKSRNQVLKRGVNVEVELDVWDDILMEHGCEVLEARLELMPRLSDAVNSLVKKMLKEDFVLDLRYNNSVAKGASDLRASYREKLRESRERDKLYRVTHQGPHRDDLALSLNGRSLSHYGSEGQCRLSSLILKAAAVELLLPVEKPECLILLIDDVLGELDEFSRRAFLKCVSRGDQVFIACTDIPAGLEDYEYTTYEVDAGRVERQ